MKKDAWKTCLALIILYIVVLALIILFPLMKLVKKTADDYENEYNTNKVRAIEFLRIEGVELEKISKQIIQEKPTKCRELGYLELCYNEENSVLIKDAKGVALAPWKLLYKDSEWYYCYKTCDQKVNISQSIKK